jgi:hypothetical protein
MDTKDEKKVVNLIKDHIAAREVFDIILKEVQLRRMDMLKQSNPNSTVKNVSALQYEAMYEAFTSFNVQLLKLRKEIII